jgi:hypothetical protein
MSTLPTGSPPSGASMRKSCRSPRKGSLLFDCQRTTEPAAVRSCPVAACSACDLSRVALPKSMAAICLRCARNDRMDNTCISPDIANDQAFCCCFHIFFVIPVRGCPAQAISSVVTSYTALFDYQVLYHTFPFLSSMVRLTA